MLFVKSLRSLQVSLDLGSNDNLGLVIRGGLEYGLGIFVTGVDDGSIASHHGIQVEMCKSFPITYRIYPMTDALSAR